MSRSAKQLANRLLEGSAGGLEDLRVQEFPDDASAHDDALIEQLHTDFTTECEHVQSELSEQYGPPLRTGQTEAEFIPLNGVFRFAVWQVGERQLFVAASHEDRGVPVLLMLGVT